MIANQNLNQIKKESAAYNTVIKFLMYALLIFLAATMVFPYVWMVFTSLKTGEEAMNQTGLSFFPKQWLFSNYKTTIDMVPLFKGALRTMIVEVTVIPIGTLVSAMAAFAFSKLKMPKKNLLILILLSGTMIPYAAVMLPQYRIYQTLGLTNTLWPLILPGLFGNVMMMFFFIQYLKGIPNELVEAAKIDGAGYLKIFFSIMLPLILPAIGVQVVFWFTGIWNDFFAPSIYLTSYETQTLQPMLAKLQSEQGGGFVGLALAMCGAVISSLPILVIYIFFQRYFVESVAITGIKG